jgi:hypothetical protein
MSKLAAQTSSYPSLTSDLNSSLYKIFYILCILEKKIAQPFQDSDDY